MNSMIHRILPKNININTITQEVLDDVAEILNNLPRKIFGYKTPNELWSENLWVLFQLVLEFSLLFNVFTSFLSFAPSSPEILV